MFRKNIREENGFLSYFRSCFLICYSPLSFIFFLNGGVWYVFIVAGLNLVRRYQYFYPVLGLIEAWRCILFLVWSLSCGKSYYCKYRFVAEIFVWFYTSLYVSNVDGGKLCFHSCEELDVVNDFIGLINFGWSFYYFWFQEVKKNYKVCKYVFVV